MYKSKCILSRSLASISGILLSCTSAIAHEFWIEPWNFMASVSEDIVADLRVGQSFKGSDYSFNESRFERFDIVYDDVVIAVPGRIGDRPALRAAAAFDGLAVVVHETNDNTLTYDDWEQFKTFVAHKDLDDTLAAHAARGLPQTGFKERYSRYAKSLVAVGSGEGADREMGLETEIVALANPYTDDLLEGFPVSLLYQGQPRVDEQIEVFARPPEGEVQVSLVRTDATGKALIPVQPGWTYMIDAVVMRPIDEDGSVWESLWANMTFQIPSQ